MDLSLPLAFTIGLFSTLHCVGMCGGIMGALSYGLAEGIRSRTPRFMAFLLAYSGGRIASYALAGALMGSVGTELLDLLGPGQGHRWLQWMAALFLVLIGLHLAGWLPRLAQVERIGVPLWRRLEPLGRRLMPVNSLPRALAYGLVWGWLPCGLVYTMLLTAASRSGSLQGALYMLAFGLGTVPAVVATGFLAGRLYRFARMPYLREAVGGIIILIGLLTLWFPELLDLAGTTT
ncbi:MAG TPA: sulfite exporter TauE/SafE family protein [Sedimenticola thiotaurini]|uniref:Sulfite exporter TauE/SafE family protein n=1 Tax=Sedimenticola thiotaurini TaxID=1543721 RepID=A0A831RKU8_9GAMM|nr:sulfite exporter TauE/SafE family protein [Sedimenticola thiotaurini]